MALWSALTALLLEYIYIALIESSKTITNVAYIIVNLICMLIFVRFIIGLKHIEGFIILILGNIIGTLILAGILELFINTTVNLKNILPVIIIICLLLPIIHKLIITNNKNRKNIFEITISTNNHTIHNMAYMDTGNSLIDPYSGKPVIIIDASLIKTIVTKEEYQSICQYIKTGNWKNIFNINIDKEHIYPITYRTIANDFAILPAFKIKGIQIGNKIHKNIVAGISPKSFPDNSEYKVLLNKNL